MFKNWSAEQTVLPSKMSPNVSNTFTATASLDFSKDGPPSSLIPVCSMVLPTATLAQMANDNLKLYQSEKV